MCLGGFLVFRSDGPAIELLHVLEPVDNEGSEGDTVEDLVVIDPEVRHGVEALNLGQQNIRLQVVGGDHELLEIGELPQLL